MIVLVLGAVVGVLYLLIAFLVKQMLNLYDDRFLIYDEIVVIMDNFTNNLGGVFDMLPQGMQENLSNLQDSLTKWAENFLTKIELPGISVLSLSAVRKYAARMVIITTKITSTTLPT